MSWLSTHGAASHHPRLYIGPASGSRIGEFWLWVAVEQATSISEGCGARLGRLGHRHGRYVATEDRWPRSRL